MCRFIETICLEKNKYPLLELHQKRVDRAFAAHFPGQKPHDLNKILPAPSFEEKHKVRIVYDAEKADIALTKHNSRQVNKIKLVRNDDIDYAYKYEDRSELQALFEHRGDADEIIIIKKRMVTDSFYANPVFWDGKNWYTPKTCLLNGVRRQHLINRGIVEETTISESDIWSFEKISLVNALVDLGECALSIQHVG